MSIKIVFEVNKEITKELDLNKVLLAVIWQNDYDEKLDLNEFKTTESNYYKKRIVLPFSLIKYQIPTILKPVEPRLPSIGFCVHYIYSFPPYLKNWIDIHLYLGGREIVIYDETENNQIVEFIKINYGENNKITVRPYEISFDNLCNKKFYSNNINI
jgi:hypothetical protein